MLPVSYACRSVRADEIEEINTTNAEEVAKLENGTKEPLNQILGEMGGAQVAADAMAQLVSAAGFLITLPFQGAAAGFWAAAAAYQVIDFTNN